MIKSAAKFINAYFYGLYWSFFSFGYFGYKKIYGMDELR